MEYCDCVWWESYICTKDSCSPEERCKCEHYLDGCSPDGRRMTDEIQKQFNDACDVVRKTMRHFYLHDEVS